MRMSRLGRLRSLGRKPFVCVGIVYSEAKRVRELLSHIDIDPIHKMAILCSYEDTEPVSVYLDERGV
jgi:hypothetical protein